MLSQSPAACSAHRTTRALPPPSNPPYTALSLFCKSHKAPVARCPTSLAADRRVYPHTRCPLAGPSTPTPPA
eukprot:908781-Prymnesium_polylepis.1